MNEYILDFSIQEATLARAGGKGANLVALARAGFEVPPGFIVTTDAYRAFVQANLLSSRILALAGNAKTGDLSAIENASAEIRALFQEGIVPEDVAADIALAYRGLDHQSSDDPTAESPVAVRSSATAEDLPGLAFAGQQDTYLYVVGAPSVLEAVKKCWGSLWTARAMTYRARNNIPPEGIALAVVVQTMVPAESSGVLFTANPVTGRRDEMVIDASFGLGEAIVAGQADPDRYVVNGGTWEIAERTLGAKAVAVVPRRDQGTESVRADRSREQALPDAQILELAKTARRVADHFGAPQDIEWAWAHGRLYLLQSRPITSLYPVPAAAGDGLRVYVNFSFTQGITGPLTPLGRHVVQLLASGILQVFGPDADVQRLAPEAGGRVFIDLTDLLAEPRLRRPALSFLSRIDPAAREIIARLAQEGRIPTRHALTVTRAPALLKGPLRLLGRVLYALRAPEEARERAFSFAEQYLATAKAHAAAAKDVGAQWSALENDLSHSRDLGLMAMPPALLALALVQVVDGWLVKWPGEKPGAALQLGRSLPRNVTTEMDLKLWEAAQKIRADSEALQAMRTQPAHDLAESFLRERLPATAQRAVGDFMSRYGMRGDAEVDIGRLRWREDPAPIFHMLQSYLQISDPAQAPDVVFRRGAEHAARLTADYITRARRTRFGWLRATILGAAIRRIRMLAALREVPLFYLVSVMDAYRSALCEGGRKLVEEKQLERPDDVFFIPAEILKRFSRGERMDLKEIAAANRAAYAREAARRQVPHVLLSTGEAFYEGHVAEGGNDLVGEGVSPGEVEGSVRVLLDPRGAHLEPGEILVCPSTDPGWTPLFLAAGGLVMQVGGTITHGSVVAREYGIPAVVGVHNATTRLKTGERVRVDGSRGRVTILEAANTEMEDARTPA